MTYEIKKDKKFNIIISGEYSPTGNKIKIDNSSVDNIDIESLNNIRVLSNLEKIKTIKEYYFDFFRSLNCQIVLDYKRMLGFKKTKEYIDYLKQEINSSVCMITSYHYEIFPLRKKCYLDLNDVLYEGNILEKPEYDHSGVTGRTSIKKGFNYLTLKKENRKKLKSSNKENILLEVDFKSCEPFFYLKSQGHKINQNDVYSWVCDNYNIKIKDRSRVKRGILALIYGANEYTISKLMGVKESVAFNIKKDLGVIDLNNRLEKEFSENGFVLNYYGRPITSNNNLVNYWIQSSTVDFCSLAFLQFCKNQNITPSFFIHDSMTFETSLKRYNNIKDITAIKENHSNIEIPVEFNLL